MTTTPETKRFEAEVDEVLNLVIHSLYSNREIFLRELVSNASDALDKRRVAALTEPALGFSDAEPTIRLTLDREQRELTIADNGIGMSREEVAENLGTIARSGTRRFAEALREADGQADVPTLIGQFGVGFYASFMVAERIVVTTRRAGEEVSTRWESRGDGEYTLEDGGDRPVGTTVSLKLKPRGEDDGEPDWADPWTLRQLIGKYSDFVEYRIEIAAEHFDGEEGVEAADGEQVVVLNSQRPLWARPKNEIEDGEYAEFYKHIAHDWNDPLETIHFRAEGTTEYTALLYLPKERPLDLLDPHREKSRIALYVKRVFVMGDCEELSPPWLRFVRGVVDSEDLPLNVSREILQENRTVRQIRSRIVRKVLDTLAAMLRDRREEYAEFWAGFGMVLKEGLVTDFEHKDALARLCLFESTRDGGPWTLEEYVGRMSDDQEAIYVLVGEDRARLEASPHLEALRKKGYEALFLTDPVDAWVVDRLTEFDGKPLKAVDRGAVDFESEEEKEEREKLDREHRNLLGSLELFLDEDVKEVRFSNRLTESPAVLVADESAMSPQMERILRSTGQRLPKSKRILELNPNHELVERMQALQESDPASDRLKDYAKILYGQALLVEGTVPPDPAEFARLVTSLMVQANPSD